MNKRAMFRQLVRAYRSHVEGAEPWPRGLSIAVARRSYFPRSVQRRRRRTVLNQTAFGGEQWEARR